MPHCLIEYSTPLTNRISRQQLLETVHHTVTQSDLFDTSNVRSRLIAFDDFILGATQSTFIHVTIRLFQGRGDAQKAELNQQVAEAIQAIVGGDVLISCECVDIHTPSYQQLRL